MNPTNNRMYKGRGNRIQLPHSNKLLEFCWCWIWLHKCPCHDSDSPSKVWNYMNQGIRTDINIRKIQQPVADFYIFQGSRCLPIKIPISYRSSNGAVSPWWRMKLPSCDVNATTVLVKHHVDWLPMYNMYCYKEVIAWKYGSWRLLVLLGVYWAALVDW